MTDARATNDQDLRDILTAPPYWQAALASKWQALGREILGLSVGPRRKLSELVRECGSLVIVAAWFESEGNITHAAQRLGASRKALRDRIVDWRQRHPELVPRAATVGSLRGQVPPPA